MKRRSGLAIVVFAIFTILFPLVISSCASSVKSPGPSTDVATVNAREAAKKARDTGKMP